MENTQNYASDRAKSIRARSTAVVMPSALASPCRIPALPNGSSYLSVVVTKADAELPLPYEIVTDKTVH